MKINFRKILVAGSPKEPVELSTLFFTGHCLLESPNHWWHQNKPEFFALLAEGQTTFLVTVQVILVSYKKTGAARAPGLLLGFVLNDV